MADDDYVYDEASGEWISAADAAARADAGDAVEVRDSVGNLLADGDQVTLIKDLVVKGAGQTPSEQAILAAAAQRPSPQQLMMGAADMAA